MLLEFLEIIGNNPYIILYGITLIVSILKYRKYFDSVLRYLPVIITYTLLTEVLGTLIRDSSSFQLIYTEDNLTLNSLVYNIFDIIFYMYFFYIYWVAIDNQSQKKIIKLGALSFIIACIINSLFQDFRYDPQILAMFVGSTVLSISACFYLKQITLLKKTISRSKNLLFWISIGVLLLYPFLPFIFSIILFLDDYWYHSLYINTIQQVLICLMYICFIIGFLKMRRFKIAPREA